MTVGVNTVKANGLASTTGWKTETGAAATSAKINDDDVNTYLRSDSTANPRYLTVKLGTFTLAANEVILAVRFKARVTQPATGKTAFAIGYYIDGNGGNVSEAWYASQIYIGSAGNAWVYGPWHLEAPNRQPWSTRLDDLAVKVTEYKKNAADTSYFKEVWAEVLVGTKPTATVIAPAEASTETGTNTPTLTVTADDADDSTSSVTNKVLTANVATLTLSAAHAFAGGEQITVSGVDATFDGTWTVNAVTSTTVSYDCVAANVASTADTGTVTSNRMRAIFGADFRVFTAAQYGIGGFNPETSPCTFESMLGTAGGSIGATPVDVSTICSTPLPSGTYRVYARVWSYNRYGSSAYLTPRDSGDVLQASDWDYNQFTISIVPPETPVVTASFDAVNNKVDLTVNGRLNALSEQDASLESAGGGVGTWVADTNASSLARSTTDYSKGSAASLSFTATGAGDCAVRTGNYAVAPSTAYRAVADVKTPSAIKSVRVDIVWLQSDGTTVISTSTGTATATAGTAAYEQRTIDATSPANAAFARVRAYVVSAAAGNVFRIDGIGIWPEQSGAWSPGGCTSTGILLERSDDGGTTWATVPGGSALLGGTAQLNTFTDYTAPRGITVQYRATQSALNAALLPVVSNASASASAAVTNDGEWWFKAYTAPSLNRASVRVTASPSYKIVKDQTIDRPLGRTGGLAVVSTGNVGGYDGSYRIACAGETEFDGVIDLLTHTGPILVQDPWGRQKWIQPGEPSWDEEGGVAQTYRYPEFDYVEIGAPD